MKKFPVSSFQFPVKKRRWFRAFFWQLATVYWLLPSAALAQGVTDMIALGTWIKDFVNVLNYILLTLLLVVFFWGLAKFILHAADAKERDNGKSLMLWGLIGIFVVISLWAIIVFLRDSVDITTDTPCFVDKYGNSIGGGNCAARN